MKEKMTPMFKQKHLASESRFCSGHNVCSIVIAAAGAERCILVYKALKSWHLNSIWEWKRHEKSQPFRPSECIFLEPHLRSSLPDPQLKPCIVLCNCYNCVLLILYFDSHRCFCVHSWKACILCKQSPKLWNILSLSIKLHCECQKSAISIFFLKGDKTFSFSCYSQLKAQY